MNSQDGVAGKSDGEGAGAEDVSALRADVADKVRLVKEWENYANHWEARGRKAETAIRQWEVVLKEARGRQSAAERTAAEAERVRRALARDCQLYSEQLEAMRASLLRNGIPLPAVASVRARAGSASQEEGQGQGQGQGHGPSSGRALP